jgi:hypothetical protein
MNPKVITCTVCGLEATSARKDGWPWLEPVLAFEDSCVEPSIVEEPIRCPNMLSAAMDAGLVGESG